MASIVTYSEGLRRIEFSATPNGPRKVIRLGRVSAKAAESIKARVETIIADNALRRAHDAETAAWLGGLDEVTLAKLRAVGLAEGVGLADTTLGEFLRRYFDALATKPSTQTFYAHTRRNLETHFGRERALRSVGPAEADGWRAWLVSDEKLAPATVARRVIAARTIWRKALRWKLVSENPFAGIRGGHQANDARKLFIPREAIVRAIGAAPNAEWKAIIALSRFGGLRCPSEHLALQWQDIDWERGTVRVRSPKTAHHEGLGERLIPLFPELRGPLLALFAEAPDGADFVITRARDAGANWRTTFTKIIRKAGLTPWPKLFHNLRASRETELMREYDLATVCRWIGNSPAVAAKHYATSVDLDADFRRAAGLDAGTAQHQAQQKAQQSAAEGDEQQRTAKTVGSAEPQENRGFVACGPSSASADKSGGWALQDSNL